MESLRIMVVGAHPDDPELSSGGYALRMHKAGHRVRFVTMTNGSAGHQAMTTADLAARRKSETEAVSHLTGFEYTVMPINDGYLEVNCQNRDMLIAELRDFRPNLIITHRANDYHPDHRNTGMLVHDASFLVMVPNVCPSAPALDFQPVVAYASDTFTLPTAFRADVVVAIDEVFDEKVAMVACHESQFYEWLPWLGHFEADVPKDAATRLAWLREKQFKRYTDRTDRYRDEILAKYGAERAQCIQACEAFMISEYGATPDASDMARLFPF